jgi:hypothetical protein
MTDAASLPIARQTVEDIERAHDEALVLYEHAFDAMEIAQFRNALNLPPRGHANATIPNGDPDMASGAMWVPAGVKRLILIGDGDSDPATTRAMLATGAERLTRLGLEVLVHFAPDGSDKIDVLLSRRQKVAA